MKALVVEIAGLNGAGKTTLSRAVCATNEYCRRVGLHSFPKARIIASILKNAPLVLAAFLSQFSRMKGAKADKLRRMMMASLWTDAVRFERKSRMLLIDEGPVQHMGVLYRSLLGVRKSALYEYWWRSVLRRWSHASNVLVYLDAPCELLIERIRSRDQRHPLKLRSDAEAQSYLQHHRSCLSSVLQEVEGLKLLTVLRLDSSSMDTAQMASQIARAASEAVK
jgi:deoxyadenosine/deoxycytidine kinase